MKSPGSCSPPLPCPSCASQRRSTIPVSVHSTAHSSAGLDRHRTAGGRNTPHRTTDDRSCVTQVIPDRLILPSRDGGYSMPFVPGSTNPCRQALNKDKALGYYATAGGSRATRASALHLGRVVWFLPRPYCTSLPACPQARNQHPPDVEIVPRVMMRKVPVAPR